MPKIQILCHESGQPIAAGSAKIYDGYIYDEKSLADMKLSEGEKAKIVADTFTNEFLTWQAKQGDNFNGELTVDDFDEFASCPIGLIPITQPAIVLDSSGHIFDPMFLTNHYTHDRRDPFNMNIKYDGTQGFYHPFHTFLVTEYFRNRKQRAEEKQGEDERNPTVYTIPQQGYTWRQDKPMIQARIPLDNELTKRNVFRDYLFCKELWSGSERTIGLLRMEKHLEELREQEPSTIENYQENIDGLQVSIGLFKVGFLKAFNAFRARCQRIRNLQHLMGIIALLLAIPSYPIAAAFATAVLGASSVALPVLSVATLIPITALYWSFLSAIAPVYISRFMEGKTLEYISVSILHKNSHVQGGGLILSISSFAKQLYGWVLVYLGCISFSLGMFISKHAFSTLAITAGSTVVSLIAGVGAAILIFPGIFAPYLQFYLNDAFHQPIITFIKSLFERDLIHDAGKANLTIILQNTLITLITLTLIISTFAFIGIGTYLVTAGDADRWISTILGPIGLYPLVISAGFNIAGQLKQLFSSAPEGFRNHSRQQITFNLTAGIGISAIFIIAALTMHLPLLGVISLGGAIFTFTASTHEECDITAMAYEKSDAAAALPLEFTHPIDITSGDQTALTAYYQRHAAQIDTDFTRIRPFLEQTAFPDADESVQTIFARHYEADVERALPQMGASPSKSQSPGAFSSLRWVGSLLCCCGEQADYEPIRGHEKQAGNHGRPHSGIGGRSTTFAHSPSGTAVRQDERAHQSAVVLPKSYSGLDSAHSAR